MLRTLSDARCTNWWLAGWGFDWIYDKAFVQPFVWAAQINKSDFVDAFYTGVARAD